MPFYYDSNRSVTSSGTPLTETPTDLGIRTIANQNTAVITALTGSARSPSGTSLAGALVRVKTFPTTANTAGSAAVPAKRRPDNPAPETGFFTGATIGTGTPTTRIIAGMSAPGGAGGWMAIERDAGLHLKPNGGITGNAETSFLAGLASVVIEYQLEHLE